MDQVDLASLKEFVMAKLGDYPFTRKVILEEEPMVPSHEFLIKVKTWLKLLEKEIEYNRLV